MEKEKLERVDLDFLRKNDLADYTEGDIVIINSLKELTTTNSLQLDMIIIIICEQGKARADIDGTPYEISADDVIVAAPNIVVDNILMSPDIDVKMMALSYSSLQRVLHAGKDIWNTMVYASQHPVFHLSADDKVLVQSYFALLRAKLEQPHNRYHKEEMHALFQYIFYEVCAIISRNMPSQTGDVKMKQGDIIFKQFLEVLAQKKGRVRNVQHVAQEMCMSPKYLSTICKQVSGKTALEWIHEFTIQEITNQLKYTNKTIKEIAHDLNFDNTSYFTKFVKAYIHISPKDFRNKPEQQV